MSSLFKILAVSLATICAYADANCKGCRKNECFRAVRGDNHPERPVQEDCSSFLATTTTLNSDTTAIETVITITAVVTESTTWVNRYSETVIDFVTITQTQTVATTTLANPYPTTDPLVNVRRALEPSQIPDYAVGECKKARNYVSACSCIGVTTGSTVTVGGTAAIIENTSTETLNAVTTLVYTTDTTDFLTVASTSTKVVEAIETVLPPEAETYRLAGFDAAGDEYSLDITVVSSGNVGATRWLGDDDKANGDAVFYLTDGGYLAAVDSSGLLTFAAIPLSAMGETPSDPNINPFIFMAATTDRSRYIRCSEGDANLDLNCETVPDGRPVDFYMFPRDFIGHQVSITTSTEFPTFGGAKIDLRFKKIVT